MVNKIRCGSMSFGTLNLYGEALYYWDSIVAIGAMLVTMLCIAEWNRYFVKQDDNDHTIKQTTCDL